MLLSRGLAPGQAAPFAYITNRGDRTVSILDTATNMVTATVPVGPNPMAFGQFIVDLVKPPSFRAGIEEVASTGGTGFS